MTIFVLFGQRKEDYPGQFAPEALEVISCYGQEENPEFLEEKLAEYTKTEEFMGLRICEVSIGSQDRLRHLLIGCPEITGQIVNEDQ